jgi:hypothetical protein
VPAKRTNLGEVVLGYQRTISTFSSDIATQYLSTEYCFPCKAAIWRQLREPAAVFPGNPMAAKIGCVNERPAETPRNPLRNEADMFRVLIMFGVGAAIVIVVALLIGSLAGVIVLAVLVAIGLWRTWGLIQDWRRYGS